MRLTIFILFIATQLFAQATDSDAFQRHVDSLLLKKYALKAHNPGVSVMVIKNGAVIYKKNVGMANLQKNIPITDSTVFNIGSVTKQFTAYCVHKLAEQGKLRLTDSIQQYIPELPYFGKTITLNHLIAHTSGIPDHLEVLGLKDETTLKRLEPDYVIRFLKKSPTLSFPTGKRFAYCNTGYMLLNVIIERVSKMTIDEYARKNIFLPLNMHSAKFVTHEKDGMLDHTTSYYLENGKYISPKPTQPNALGATGMFCTLDDFRKWDAHFIHPTPKNKSIITKMLQPYLLNNNTSCHYGGGIILKPYKGYAAEEHSGGWNSFWTQCRRLPEFELSVLVQSTSTANNVFKICDDITDWFLPQENIAVSIKRIENNSYLSPHFYTGTYIDANNVVRRLIYEDGNLAITNLKDTNTVIQRLSFKGTEKDSLFHFTDNNKDTLSLVYKNNKIKGFYWSGGTYFRFKRFYERLEPFKPNFATFTGKYTSKTMNYGFSIKQNKAKKLRLSPIFFMNYDLEYLGGNVFKVKNEPIYLRFYDKYISVGNEWVFNLILNKK